MEASSSLFSSAAVKSKWTSRKEDDSGRTQPFSAEAAKVAAAREMRLPDFHGCSPGRRHSVKNASCGAS